MKVKRFTYFPEAQYRGKKLKRLSLPLNDNNIDIKRRKSHERHGNKQRNRLVYKERYANYVT